MSEKYRQGFGFYRDWTGDTDRLWLGRHGMRVLVSITSAKVAEEILVMNLMMRRCMESLSEIGRQKT